MQIEEFGDVSRFQMKSADFKISKTQESMMQIRATTVWMLGFLILTITLLGGIANADGSWTIGDYIMDPTESVVVITPAGSSLGAGGFCYDTWPPPAAYSLVNAAGVSARTTYSGHRTATWNYDPANRFGPAYPIKVSLTVHVSGTWETGATSSTNYTSDADATCIGSQ